jgi:hypothetical protein
MEVWSWRDQLSNAFSRLDQQYHAMIRIHDLDSFHFSVTFVKGGVFGPPEITPA